MFAHLIALMLWLVPADHHKFQPEDPADVVARYTVIAHAIADEVGEDRRLALYLLTVARHESTFARSVHAGERRGDDGRSWGLFQIMVGRRASYRIKDHPKEWRARDIVGLSHEATARSVWTAAWVLRDRIEGCEGQPTCTFKAYGGVRSGPMRGETKRRILARVDTYRRLVAKLEELEAE